MKIFLALLLVGCGSASHPVCPSEKHSADPDGAGERCISDRSSCDAPSDCVADSECCTASCVDDDGSGVYACEQSCRSPECTEGSCGVGFRCQQGVDACSAYCVPDDLPCEDGFILGDPTGTGTWQCIRADSACSRRSDCPDSQDGCCLGTCIDQGDLRFACSTDCAYYGADSDREGAPMWECSTDEDCVNMMGQPGWTCVPTACTGNECRPPAPECDSDDDCVLAIDMMNCCADCATAYSLTEIANDECLSVQVQGDQGAEPPSDPAVCEPNCYAIDCPAIECVPPVGVSCAEGQCVPTY